MILVFEVPEPQECLSVCKNGRYYISVSQHANIWLGKLLHLPGGSNLVVFPFDSPSADADSFLVIKVSLKEIRRGCVQKQQALILDVSGLT